jgi:uncharacterized protein (TIGR03118 family)
MRSRILRLWPRVLAAGVALAALLFVSFQIVPRVGAQDDQNGFYQQTNLVSDLPGEGTTLPPDTHLVNPWGLVSSATSPFWISENGTGLTELFNGQGQQIVLTKSGNPIVIPPPKNSPPGTLATPTGVVFNGSGDFVVSSAIGAGPARFIFATEDGTISGWSPAAGVDSAVREVDNSPGAVYKGLAIGSSGGKNYLYATNFRAGTIDIFNASYGPASLDGSFTDPDLPRGYAPFGIANIGGHLIVTYAVQNAALHDDVAGPAHGIVDEYDTTGHLLQRLVTHGRLNSPWGIALAPAHFGRFSNDLLIGNFGDGRINAYAPSSSGELEFQGQLRDKDNRPITIDGLWALEFGNDHAAGPSTTLFFTAGINGEADGLFGTLTAVHG